MLYKLWKSRSNAVYCINADSMDEAFKLVREVNPEVDTAQACSEDEANHLNLVIKDCKHIISVFPESQIRYFTGGKHDKSNDGMASDQTSAANRE